MVKELEDSPRDEIAIVLDADAGRVAESFDTQVRAAGSILRTHASRGRRAVLVAQRLDAAQRPRLVARQRLAGGVRGARGGRGRRLAARRGAALAGEPGGAGARARPRHRAAVAGARHEARAARPVEPRRLASSGSTRRASPAGRRGSSPSCSGCSSRASRSRSSARGDDLAAALLGARPAQRRRPCLERRVAYSLPALVIAISLASARGAGGSTGGRPRRARARAGALADASSGGCSPFCRRSSPRSGSPSTRRRSRRGRRTRRATTSGRSGRRSLEGCAPSTTCACRSPAPTSRRCRG